MPEFIADQYISRTHPAAVRHSVDAARRAARPVTCDGASVRLLRSVFVPEDETCIHLYEADSIQCVQLAAARAGLRLDRIAPALSQAVVVTTEGGNDEAPKRANRTITRNVGVTGAQPPGPSQATDASAPAPNVTSRSASRAAATSGLVVADRENDEVRDAGLRRGSRTQHHKSKEEPWPFS